MLLPDGSTVKANYVIRTLGQYNSRIKEFQSFVLFES